MFSKNMYNNQNSSSDHHHHHHRNNGGAPPPPSSPRISFSNDFIDPSYSHSRMRGGGGGGGGGASYSDAPVSSDFEFSVSNYSMSAADELFCKGRLLPFKENCRKAPTTTLRDELQHEDASNEDFSLRPPKNPARWRGFLGLKKSHIASKRSDNKGESSSRQSFQAKDSVE